MVQHETGGPGRRLRAREVESSLPHREPVLLAPAVTLRPRYRFARLKCFPDMLPCAIVGESEAIVLAVAHERRQSGYWLPRAEGLVRSYE